MSRSRVLRVAGLVTMLAASWGAAPASAQKTQSQRFFEERLIADRETTAPIKALLRTGGGFVERRVGFRDLTGDKRDDAVVRVNSGGAAGVVAVYVFSTANRKGGQLRAIFRSQRLIRASTRVAKGVLTYRTSRYGPDDEMCCPALVTDSTLAWDADTRRLRVRERTTFAPPPEAQAPAAP